jgi:PAS domain S-box-containing protein
MPASPWRHRVGSGLPVACGAATVLLGGVVIVGWVARSPTLVQVLPTLVPMQFNTALGLAGAGASLLLQAKGRPRAALLALAVPLLLGGATLLQDYGHMELGIDQWFVKPFTSVHTDAPGRMSVNSAVTFLVTGGGLALLLAGRRHHWPLLPAATLGAAVAGIAFNTLFGYATDTEIAYGWTEHSQMAVHTAAGFLLVSVGVFARAWFLGRDELGDAPAWVAIPVIVSCLLPSVGVWQVLREHEARQAGHVVEVEAASQARAIRTEVMDRVLALQRMAHDLELRPDPPRAQWEQTAGHALLFVPGFKAIEYIDQWGTVKWVMPRAGNEAVIDMEAAHDPVRKRFIEIARSTEVGTLTPRVLLVQGGDGFLVYVPFLREGRSYGLLAGVFRYGDLLSDLAATTALRDLNFSIDDNNQIVFRSGADPALEQQWGRAAFVHMLGRTWRISVWPTARRADSLRSATPKLALLLGLTLTVLLGIAVHSDRNARRQARQLSDSNAQLTREIAERRRAEQNFRQLVELTPNGIVVTDRSGRITLVNTEALKFFGYRREELLGEPVQMLLPVASRGEHAGHVNRYMDSPGMRPMGTGREFYGRRKDGSQFPVDISLSPLESSEGLQVIAAITDMTSYRAAAAAQRRLQEGFERLVSANPNALIVCDAEGRIVLVSDQTMRWFGYQREEMIGQPVELLVPEHLREKHVGEREHYMRAPVIRPMGTGRELYARRRDGSEFPVDITLSPFEAPEGLRIIAALTDMTEHMRTEAELKHANEAQRAVNQELESFAYSVSHDLRQPLRAMVGFGQMLLEDHAAQLDERGRDYLVRIHAAANRMGELIDALLRLTRITRAKLAYGAVDLTALAWELVAELEDAEPERSVSWSIGEGMVVNGDKALLRVALQNLIANAWKFTSGRSEARIEVGCSRSNGVSEFFVRDNGAGFDMAYSDKLFGAFQRLHGATEFPGTGIGLATTQRILHRHGGSIRAEAAVGHGATFYFSL